MHVLWSRIKIVWVIPVWFKFSSPGRLLNIYRDLLKKPDPQCGCVSKLTIKNGKRYILLTGISIVIPGSERGCVRETEENRKKPKGRKSFPLSSSSWLPTCFINIQPFPSFISAFLNQTSFDLTCPIFRRPLHLGTSASFFPCLPGRCQQGERRDRGRGWVRPGGSGGGQCCPAVLPSSAQPRPEASHSRRKVLGEC